MPKSREPCRMKIQSSFARPARKKKGKEDREKKVTKKKPANNTKKSRYGKYETAK